MLQETALRLQGFTHARLAPQPLLITNEEYRFIIDDQLAQVGIDDCRVVLEPVGRNTAPALTVAALLATGGASLAPDGTGRGYDDPILLVMPSDHLIADVPALHKALAEGADQAADGAIVVFGVVPHTPETGYGYIRPGAPVAGARTARALDGFAEKPDADNARRYLADGYLWNSGMFMVKASVWLAAIEQCRPDIAAACRAAVAGGRTEGIFVSLSKAAFSGCPSESIDYAVMERLGQVQRPAGLQEAAERPGLKGVVIPLEAGWSDLGAWDAVWVASPKDEAGNVVRGNVVVEDGRGSLLESHSRLVAVLGVEDLTVIETADAVLVAPRNRTADLKRLVDRLSARDESVTRYHRRVYRPWGWYESVDQGPRFQVKRLMVAPGASMSLQYHRHRAEHWVVVSGVAEVTCDGRVFRLEENQSTYVPRSSPHRLSNPGDNPVEIIEVQSGDYLGEDDIIRLQDDYGRIEST
jgi:mannose-1-phosphate guanylyltransferase/mannose-6-phosphate isomerase